MSKSVVEHTVSQFPKGLLNKIARMSSGVCGIGDIKQYDITTMHEVLCRYLNSLAYRQYASSNVLDILNVVLPKSNGITISVKVPKVEVPANLLDEETNRKTAQAFLSQFYQSVSDGLFMHYYDTFNGQDGHLANEKKVSLLLQSIRSFVVSSRDVRSSWYLTLMLSIVGRYEAMVMQSLGEEAMIASLKERLKIVEDSPLDVSLMMLIAYGQFTKYLSTNNLDLFKSL